MFCMYWKGYAKNVCSRRGFISQYWNTVSYVDQNSLRMFDPANYTVTSITGKSSSLSLKDPNFNDWLQNPNCDGLRSELYPNECK